MALSTGAKVGIGAAIVAGIAGVAAALSSGGGASAGRAPMRGGLRGSSAPAGLPAKRTRRFEGLAQKGGCGCGR